METTQSSSHLLKLLVVLTLINVISIYGVDANAVSRLLFASLAHDFRL